MFAHGGARWRASPPRRGRGLRATFLAHFFAAVIMLAIPLATAGAPKQGDGAPLRRPRDPDGRGVFEAGANQALTVGQTSYVFLVTRGAHGASSFHDEAGSTWNPVYNDVAGSFVCQMWASDISNGSTDKGTKLVWEGLPESAYVYRALVAVDGKPVASDALDVGASSATRPNAENVAVTTPVTHGQGDFGMAVVATSADGQASGPGQRVSG